MELQVDHVKPRKLICNADVMKSIDKILSVFGQFKAILKVGALMNRRRSSESDGFFFFFVYDEFNTPTNMEVAFNEWGMKW